VLGTFGSEIPYKWFISDLVVALLRYGTHRLDGEDVVAADIITLLGFFVRRAKEGDSLLEKHSEELLTLATATTNRILTRPGPHATLGPASLFLVAMLEKIPKHHDEILDLLVKLFTSPELAPADVSSLFPPLGLYLSAQQDEKKIAHILRLLLHAPRQFSYDTGVDIFGLFYHPPDSKLKNAGAPWYQASQMTCAALLDEPNTLDSLLPILFAGSALL